jgi:hypothetical protein
MTTRCSLNLHFIIAGIICSACSDPVERPPGFILDGMLTSNYVYTFEVDSRARCELHGMPLKPAQVPVIVGGAIQTFMLLSNAPHGRLSVEVGHWYRTNSTIEINRCDECTRISEHYYRTTREEGIQRELGKSRDLSKHAQ